MSRPLRIEFPGAYYHVTSRGARRSPIFEDHTDRDTFLGLLGRIVQRFDWRCEAYCLMGNHYHLLVRTPRPNLSRGMQQLNGPYSQHFNRRHGYVGPVFQGRFHSVVVDAEAYRLEVARYVVLNPVRAGLVPHPQHWHWSSYGATIGKRERPEWLAYQDLLSAFASDERLASDHYIRFVNDGLGKPGPWGHVRNRLFLGDQSFVESAIQRSAALERADREMPREHRQAIAGNIADFVDSEGDHDAAMRAAWDSGLFTLREIAEHFGLHYSTVSRIVRR
ncbi:MAG: REP-associated tyrosine transposase [Gammaproteobacteria bacterium]